MIDRRTLLCAAATTFAAATLESFAQPARVYRIGILRPTSRPQSGDRVTAEYLLPAAFRRLGYAVGHDLIIEWRYAEGNIERLPVLARELVRGRMDVIIAITGAAVRAAEQATATIPIIMFGNFDPVANGFVTNLARPERNVTGVLIAPEGTLAGKKLDLLRQTVPHARRIAVLAPEDPTSAPIQLRELQQAAAALGVELALVSVRHNNYADAFLRIAATRPDALFVLAESYFLIDRKKIIDPAIKYRLASMWEWREQVEDGGLMAYGSGLSERYQRVAEYVHRILRGNNPGELPVDQPTKFELVINLQTAKAIGLAIPYSVLVAADGVIQ